MCKQIVGKAFGLEDKALPDDHQAWHVHYVGELYKARAYFHVEEGPAPSPSRASEPRGEGGSVAAASESESVTETESMTTHWPADEVYAIIPPDDYNEQLAEFTTDYMEADFKETREDKVTFMLILCNTVLSEFKWAAAGVKGERAMDFRRMLSGRVMRAPVDQLNLHNHFDLYWKLIGEVLNSDEYVLQHPENKKRQLSRAVCLYALARHIMDVLKCEPIDTGDLVQIVEGTRAQLDKVMQWFHITKDPRPEAAPSPSRASEPWGEGASAVAAEPAEVTVSLEEDDDDQADIANMVMSVVNSLQAQNPNVRVQFLGAYDRGAQTDFTPQRLQELMATMNLNQAAGASASASSSSPPAAGSFQGTPFSGQGHRLD